MSQNRNLWQSIWQRLYSSNARIVGTLICFFIGVGLVAAISMMTKWDKKDHSFRLDLNIWNNLLDNLDFVFGSIYGFIFCLVIILASHRALLVLGGVSKDVIKERSFWMLTGLGLLLLIGSIQIKYDILDKSNKVDTSSLNIAQRFITNDPGGLFAIIIGTFSLFGIWLNLKALWEIKRSITSFPQLIDRVTEMAKIAKKNNDTLHIIAYTPALGALSEGDSVACEGLYTIIRGMTDTSKERSNIDIICLEEQDLSDWHSLFLNRTTYRGKLGTEDVSRATESAKNILTAITLRDRTNISRTSRDKMPGFYLFFTKETAIIVTPLFLPFHSDVSKEFQEELQMVQMIGIETQDRLIISQVSYFYDLQKKSLNSASQSTGNKKIEKTFVLLALGLFNQSIPTQPNTNPPN